MAHSGHEWHEWHERTAAHRVMGQVPGGTRLVRCQPRRGVVTHQVAVAQAVQRLEREHTALVAAIAELELPMLHGGETTDAQQVRSALLTLLREDLRQTRRALLLAATGRYGRCESCGRALSSRHLAHQPTATRCALCPPSPQEPNPLVPRNPTP